MNFQLDTLERKYVSTLAQTRRIFSRHSSVVCDVQIKDTRKYQREFSVVISNWQALVAFRIASFRRKHLQMGKRCSTINPNEFQGELKSIAFTSTAVLSLLVVRKQITTLNHIQANG